MKRDETFSSGSTTRGDLLHDCSPQCPNGAAASRDEIARIIRRASETDVYNSGRRFISKQALIDNLDTQTTLCLLRACSLSTSENDAWEQKAAAYISPEAGQCRCETPRCSGARIIFVMLSLSAREDMASRLPKGGICDTDLPLRVCGTRLETQSDKRCDLLDAMQKWPVKEKRMFCHFQWAMLPHFFERKACDIETETFDPEVILPWCEDQKDPWGLLEGGGESYTSMYGQDKTIIRKVRISKHCHDLEAANDYFALKNSLQKRFYNEVAANVRTLKGHRNITPLLAAFEHTGLRYMLFPWAESGSLDLFWQEYPHEQDSPLNPPWRTPSWLWEQCSGLASALAFIHGYPEGETEGEIEPQLHADIQPKNILCFKTPGRDGDGNTSYTLRISDFEFAKKFDSPTTEEWQMCPSIHPIYYPPELRTYGNMARVTLKWDVWSLACVLLELLSWFTLGDKVGIKKFISDREGDTKLPGMDWEIADVTFFRLVPTSFWSRIFGYSTGATGAEVSRPVREKMIELEEWWRKKKQRRLGENKIWSYEGRVEELVGFIERHMLIVDLDTRADSDSIRQFFDKYHSG